MYPQWTCDANPGWSRAFGIDAGSEGLAHLLAGGLIPERCVEGPRVGVMAENIEAEVRESQLARPLLGEHHCLAAVPLPAVRGLDFDVHDPHRGLVLGAQPQDSDPRFALDQVEPLVAVDRLTVDERGVHALVRVLLRGLRRASRADEF